MSSFLLTEEKLDGFLGWVFDRVVDAVLFVENIELKKFFIRPWRHKWTKREKQS